jgi:hypothetical protein
MYTEGFTAESEGAGLSGIQVRDETNGLELICGRFLS